MRKIISILLFSITFSFSLPAFANNKDDFIKLMLPPINDINSEVSAQRDKLLKLEEKQKNNHLSARDKKWLTDLASDYKVTGSDFSQPKSWEALKLKVDIIPPSLALAQAATESGWGRSRFAKNGNNYFGQSCFRRGCGMKPNTKFSHGYYEVQKFNSIHIAVRSYIRNLNTHNAYTSLRKIRYDDRSKIKNPESLHMVKGLTRYSERGQAYVTYISGMVKGFKQKNVDQFI